MIYVDDDTKEKIQKIDFDSSYFLINFDNVITDSSSSDTWNVITDNITLSKRTSKKLEQLRFKCMAMELDTSIDYEDKSNYLMDLWREKIELLGNSKIDDKKIKKIISNKCGIRIRDGAKDFLKLAYEEKIPMFIISDGITEVIENLLDINECKYNNIHIIANKILSASEIDASKIIHPLNKNELAISNDLKTKIQSRDIAILLASSINDINILSKTSLKKSIKIAFLDNNINENFDTFLNYFNIICTHNTSLNKIIKKQLLGI